MSFGRLFLFLVVSESIVTAQSSPAYHALLGPEGSAEIVVPRPRGNLQDFRVNDRDKGGVIDQVQGLENEQHSSTCSLYLARSTIPGAGLGVFTGIDVEEGKTIASMGVDDDEDHAWFQDLLIPILDKYKTIPYRGHQRYLSWLGYVWSEEVDTFHHSYHDGAYPALSDAHYATPSGLNGADQGLYYFYYSEDDDTEMVPINVLAPGIASIVNSNPSWVNVAMDDETSITLNAEGADEEEMIDPVEDAFKSSYTRLAPGSAFVAQVDVPAGSELFIDYGDEWHTRYDAKAEVQDEFKHQNGIPDYQDLESFWNPDQLASLPSEQDKRNKQRIMNQKIATRLARIDQIEEKRRLHVAEVLRVEKTKTNKNQNTPTGSHDVEQRGSASYSDPSKLQKTDTMVVTSEDSDDVEEDMEGEYDQEDDEEDETPPHRDMDWLRSNGACLDNLHVRMSTIPGIGRGAFANRFLSKGDVIAPAPLLALKRSDLIIYETDEDARRFQHTLDLTKIVGHEILLNYCYGHPASDLLLVPFSPAVNFINHHVNTTMINAEIRWPSDERSLQLLNRLPREWLEAHPLDVTDQSGKLLMEFVALRDIHPGEEIFVSYGADWQEAWEQNEATDSESFRHEIGVPDGFYPSTWLNQTIDYEVARIEHLHPGEIQHLTWKHNGQPVADNTFVVGLPENFTTHIKGFAEERGILNLYEQLLAENVLGSDQWYVFDADQHEGAPEEWFALRYKSVTWDFNMHYIAAWNEHARISTLRALGEAGFDTVLDSIGRHFGLDSLTCFHTSFMGVSEADKSFMHTDIYATDGTAFNIIFPIITVDGSKPELDIQSDNADVVVAVNYEHDRAVLMADWGYHRTSAVEYSDKGKIRVVMGMYCGQLDESNHDVFKFIYNGEDPAPFMDQFDLPIKEIHWDKSGKHHLPR